MTCHSEEVMKVKVGKRLPQAVRFIHTADWHLSAETMQEGLGAVAQVLQLADEVNVNGILVSGDVWDHGIRVEDSTPFVPLMEMLNEGNIPGLVIYGNHDRPGSLDWLNLLDGWTVLNMPETGLVMPGSHGLVRIHALPFPRLIQGATQQESYQLTNNALGVNLLNVAGNVQQNPGQLHVLMPHITISGSRLHNSQVLYGHGVELSATELEQTGVDYVAAGHIHLFQQLGNRTFFPGSIFPVNYGETDDKSVNLVEFTMDGMMTVTRCYLDVVKMATLEFTWDGETLTAANDMMTQVLRQGGQWNLKLRISYPEGIPAPDAEAIPELAEVIRIVKPVKLKKEPVLIPGQKTRAAEVRQRTSLKDKLQAWVETQNITVDIQALQDKCETVENEVTT